MLGKHCEVPRRSKAWPRPSIPENMSKMRGFAELHSSGLGKMTSHSEAGEGRRGEKKGGEKRRRRKGRKKRERKREEEEEGKRR